MSPSKWEWNHSFNTLMPGSALRFYWDALRAAGLRLHPVKYPEGNFHFHYPLFLLHLSLTSGRKQLWADPTLAPEPDALAAKNKNSHIKCLYTCISSISTCPSTIDSGQWQILQTRENSTPCPDVQSVWGGGEHKMEPLLSVAPLFPVLVRLTKMALVVCLVGEAPSPPRELSPKDTWAPFSMRSGLSRWTLGVEVVLLGRDVL